MSARRMALLSNYLLYLVTIVVCRIGAGTLALGRGRAPAAMLPPAFNVRINFVSPTLTESGEPFVLAIDNGTIPTISWALPTVSDVEHRGLNQSAFRVVIQNASESRQRLQDPTASELASQAVVWDSGRIVSSDTYVTYAGPSLPGDASLLAAVAWWSSDGQVSPFSQGEPFDVEPPAPFDDVSWIGTEAQRMLRTVFTLPTGKLVARARLRVAAPGCAVVRLNGRAVGDQSGVCPWTYPWARLKYMIYNVTDMLNDGDNTLGVLAGHGMWGHWYGGVPVVKIQMSIAFADGSTTQITSAPGALWNATAGPLLQDDPFDTTVIDWGEYDRQQGWDTAGFDCAGKGWDTAVPATNPPDPNIFEVLRSPPSRVVNTIKPASVVTVQNGDTVYDMGTNFVGTVRVVSGVTVGPGGGNVTLRHGEWLNADGSVNLTYAGHSADDFQADVHVLTAGRVTHALLPTFTWHGFQYVQVHASGNATFSGSLEDVEGLEIHTDVVSTGSVMFDDDINSGGSGALLHDLQRMILTSQRGNIAAYMPTDCPTREKHGWLGDAQVTAEEALFNFDMSPIYDVFLDNILDAQTPSGDVPGVVPATARPEVFPSHQQHVSLEMDRSSQCADISWTAAYPLISRWVWEYVGDKSGPLSRYESLARYMQNLLRIANTTAPTPGLATCWTWGDWCAVQARAVASPATGPELAGAHFVAALDAMSVLAELAGRSSDETTFRAAATRARRVLHATYFNVSENLYGAYEIDAQTLTSVPLALGGIVPQSLLAAVSASFAENVNTTYRSHLTVGSTGQKFLLRTLTDLGYFETAMSVATRTSFPSWGYWLRHGRATSCWENWSGVADPSHPPPPTHNHIFLCGGLGEWIYKDVAGVRPAGSGFRATRFAPHVSATVGPASSNASLLTTRGYISVSWKRTVLSVGVAAVSLQVAVPTNAVATVVVPSAGIPGDELIISIDDVTVWRGVSGFNPRAVSGVVSGHAVSDGVEIAVLSGTYKFVTSRSATLRSG